MTLDTCFVESFNNVLNIFHDKEFHSGPSSIGCALIWHFYSEMRTPIVRTRVSAFPSIKHLLGKKESVISALNSQVCGRYMEQPNHQRNELKSLVAIRVYIAAQHPQYCAVFLV